MASRGPQSMFRFRWTRGIFAAGFSLCAGLAPATAGPAQATEAPEDVVVRLELNRLEPQGEACRAYLLIDNSKGDAMRSLKVDLFALDTDGVAQRRIAVEIGPVPYHKTLIKLFDFAGIGCSKVGRVLLNDILACTGPKGPHEDCLAHTETTSKVAAVAFVK